MTHQDAIVIVGDEELFVEFLGGFPQDCAILFASDLAEAERHCAAHTPRLIVIARGVSSEGLVQLVDLVHRRGGLALGVGDLPKDSLDVLVPADDRREVLRAARELLGERRQLARANVELAVEVLGESPTVASDITAEAIFVPREPPLAVGEKVPLAIMVDSQRLECTADVGRVGRGGSGSTGMVLRIPEQAANVRDFLDSSTQRALILERFCGAGGPDAPPDKIAEPEAPPPPQRRQGGVAGPRPVGGPPREARAQEKPPVHPQAATRESTSLVGQLEGLAGRVAELERRVADQVSSLQQRVASQVASLEQRIARLLAERTAADGKQPACVGSATDRAGLNDEPLVDQINSLELLVASSVAALENRLASIAKGTAAADDLATARKEQSALAGRLDELATHVADLRQGAAGPTASVESTSAAARQEQAALMGRLDELERRLAQHSFAPGPATGRFEDLVDRPAALPRIPSPAADLHDEPTKPHGSQDALILPGEQDEATRPRGPKDAGPSDFHEEPTRPGGSMMEQAALAASAWGDDEQDEVVLNLDAGEVLEQPAETPHAAPVRVAVTPVEVGETVPPLLALTPFSRLWGSRRARYVTAGGALLLLIVVTLVAVRSLRRSSEAPDRQIKTALGGEDLKRAPREQPSSRETSPPAEVTPATRPAAQPDGDAADAKKQQLSPAAQKQLERRQRRLNHLKAAAELIGARRLPEARRQLTIALKLSDDYQVRRMLAVSHERAGELWAAAYHLDKALAKAPRQAKPALADHLGTVLVRVGQRAQACSRFKAATEAGFKPAGKHLKQHCGK
jgi:hypothetical protein